MGTTIREALAAANKKLMGKIDDAMNTSYLAINNENPRLPIELIIF